MKNPFEPSGGTTAPHEADAVAPGAGDPFARSPEVWQREPLTFSGGGAEYFGIWITNLALTLLTLGIYSAWAKVRRLQYFHRHTTLAGAGFDYHGDPRAILKGRVIGLLLLLAYNLSFQFSTVAGLIVAAGLTAVMPVLLMRALRFRAHNSSWRGLRFGFDGDAGGAYSAFLKWPLFTVMTLGLLGPMWHQRMKQYQFNHARYGTQNFFIDAPVRAFYRIYGVAIGCIAAGVIAILAALAALAEGTPSAFMLMPLLLLALMLFVQPYLSARVQNLVWNHTRLGQHRFESCVSARRLYAITMTNLLGVVLTLGLFLPFAAIRLARYRLECVTLLSAGSVDDFVAGQQRDVAATGEEAADLFDVDIAL
ncbi:MAG: DUF898 domain-containing protein [Methyloversatilis sp.]|nr:DUF898 domain-containing protein [Methyloversatilis sp.]MBP6193692.1 DUF898 domain-containing protein [Methyloversatilis sp.]MBP9117350.1 DUF898 domain-containing protein [Methyloversatilis sp.]